MKIHNPILPPERLEDLPACERALASWVRRSHTIHTMGGLVVGPYRKGQWVAAYAEVSTVSWKTISTVRQDIIPDKRFDIEAHLEWALCRPLYEFFQSIETTPDMMFVLGDGINHQRGFGLACHVGVMLDIPTVAVQDNPPTYSPMRWKVVRGNHCTVASDNRGSILDEVVTKDHLHPIQVSIGHRVDCAEATKLVLQATPIHRLPHPLIAAINMAELAP